MTSMSKPENTSIVKHPVIGDIARIGKQEVAPPDLGTFLVSAGHRDNVTVALSAGGKLLASGYPVEDSSRRDRSVRTSR